MSNQTDLMDAQKSEDFYIVVDVETSGPTPEQYALLSIGACTISDPRQTFYIELQPDVDDALEEAMRINKLSLDDLRKTGLPPYEALAQFSGWINEVLPQNRKPVFTALMPLLIGCSLIITFSNTLAQTPLGIRPWISKHITWEFTAYPGQTLRIIRSVQN